MSMSATQAGHLLKELANNDTEVRMSCMCKNYDIENVK